MTLKRNVVIVGVASALLVLGVLAGSGVVALAAGPTPTPQTPNGWGPGGMMGGNGGFGGMMGGSLGPTSGYTGTMPFGGSGCFSSGGTGADQGTPLTVDQAIQAAQQYVARDNNPDLHLTEIMEFSNNFYVAVAESSTGIHAFELLVDRFSGNVRPEYGPNMMWNTKYGMMGSRRGMMGGWGGMMGDGGMMGGWGGMMGDGGMTGGFGGGRRAAPNPETGAAMSVTPEQARQYAQTWLNANQPGTTAADDPSAFYGYYTLDFERDGQPAGMLSVNGYSGAVWYHTWHGAFIAESALN